MLSDRTRLLTSSTTGNIANCGYCSSKGPRSRHDGEVASRVSVYLLVEKQRRAIGRQRPISARNLSDLLGS